MWAIVKFGNVVENKNESSKNPASEGLTRVVGLDDMDSESLPLRRWSEIGDLPDGTTFTRKFSSGEVLFGKRRSYQKKVSVPDFDGVCSGDILVFEAKKIKMLNDFLPLVVQSADFMSHAVATSAGSLSPRTKWSDLAKYQFCLPSLKDQEKIIEIISSIDQTIEAYQDLPLKSQRESMLHGLLTAGGEDWTETNLGDVALINPEATKNFEDDKIITYVDLSSVSAEHGISKELSIGPYQNAPGRARRVIRTDDVLISTVRPYLRGFAIVPEYLDGEVASTGFSVLRAKTERTIPGFIWALISTGQFVDFLMNKASGSNYPAVRPEDVSSYDFDLPPLKEQRRIVEIVSAIDEVVQSTAQAIRDLKALRRSLLTEILSANDNG